MQLSLALDPTSPVAAVHRRLKSAFGPFAGERRLSPLDQLVAALISSRTRDEVSWAAYLRLESLFRPWERLAEASPEAVEAAIAQVTHADVKAGWLPETLRRIASGAGGLSLDFLADTPVEEAMTWLQALPGVGDKTAAATLNFSTLRRPVMVVETHVWRTARRIGLAPRNAEPAAVRRAIMEAAPPTWDGEDYFDLHWLLKRLGQSLCLDQRTRCGACPVAALCASRGQAARAPLRPGTLVRPAFGARESRQ
jgi:endonuclease-3